MSAVVACPNCGRTNRVRPSATATPRCGNCGKPLPWVVDADEGAFAEETHAPVPVVVDFWAPWCGPCRMVGPALEHIAERHAGRLKVVKVNVDDQPGLAERFQTMSIPTLVVMEDGQETDRIIGALPEPRLEERLASRLAPAG